MKIFLLHALFVLWLSPQGDSLQLPSLPVLIPFMDPHTDLSAENQMALNQQPVLDPEFKSEFDVVFQHRLWNLMVKNYAHKMMAGVKLNPREVFYANDIKNLMADHHKQAIDWANTPSLILSGHGGPGFPMLGAPQVLFKNQQQQSSDFLHVEELSVIIQQGLQLPLDFSGTISCLSCDAGIGLGSSPSFASALSTQLYQLGYEKLTVEGPIGSITQVRSSAQILNNFEPLYFSGLAALLNQTLENKTDQWQVNENIMGFDEWVVDVHRSRLIPFHHSDARKHFINGREIFPE